MADPARLPLRADAVLFDLDGTLVHTAPDLAEAIGCMLEDLGRARLDLSRVEGWIGDGVARLVKRALTGERDGEPDPVLFERGFARFVEHYGRMVSQRSRPYPGVREGLATLHARGVPLACVTSKAAVFTRALLRDLALERCFSVVVSGDSVPRKKPDPLPVLHACERLGVDPASSVLVGDSRNDALAARAAGARFVAVSWGYHGADDPRSLGADLVIDAFEQLAPALALPARPPPAAGPPRR